MSRPYTLFTGQWADLTLEEVASHAAEWGYDGLEIAVSGEHLDAWRWDDEDYVAGRLEILERHGLGLWAISNHLTGQAVFDDPIDQRHKDILPAAVWGDGDPEGVRQRAAERMAETARAAAKLGVDVVIGFTGSAIWKYVAMFPPVSAATIEAGYQDFADRWNPILDVYDEVGVRFAHEVHPSEIAYDHWTTVRTLEAIDHRPHRLRLGQPRGRGVPGGWHAARRQRVPQPVRLDPRVRRRAGAPCARVHGYGVRPRLVSDLTASRATDHSRERAGATRVARTR